MEKTKARLAIQVYCPSCDQIMWNCGNGEMCCKNSACDQHHCRFEVPVIELVSVKEPEPEVPQWPHPDSLVAKLLGWPESMRDAAKIKELRERLREIEWDIDDFGNTSCHACYGHKYKVDPNAPLEIGHKPDCWLRAEIDQLED